MRKLERVERKVANEKNDKKRLPLSSLPKKTIIPSIKFSTPAIIKTIIIFETKKYGEFIIAHVRALREFAVRRLLALIASSRPVAFDKADFIPRFFQ